MAAEVAAYDSIFPNVHLTLVPLNARDAVVKLLSGETKLVVLGRRFLEDEQALVAKYNVVYGEYEIAKDGLAVIMNKRNPVDTMSVGVLRGILSETHQMWGGEPPASYHANAFPIRVAIPNSKSSAYRHLLDGVTHADVKSADLVCDSVQQLLADIRKNEGAVGVADWNAVWNDTTVKVLRIADVDSAGTLGAYALLHPAFIFRKTYPLRHSIYGYTTEGRPALAKGFMAFVCNADGQRITLNQQLVPATQIIKIREQ